MLLRSAVAAMVVVAAGPLLTGCAEDEVAPQGAAYPAPSPVVGQTPPSQVGVNASLPPAPPPYDPQAESAGAAPAEGSQDVVVDGQQPVPSAAPAGAAQDEYADTDPSALSDFRATLDPYGTWVDDATYGTVWVPSQSVVGQDFVPYQTAGHWVYDDDYTWVSDYDWGWAPFHYGRWVYAGGYGWEWIPGRVYAGAWVSWRYGWGDWAYVGWAPLGPTWGWWGGYAYGLGYVPVMPYTFCATGSLFSPNLRGAVITGPRAGTIAQNTRPYVPANPSVNGRVAATPRVSGPSPQMLNIPAAQIAHGATANRGVAQAVAFARPSTATALGARAPAQAYAPRAAGSPRGFAAASPGGAVASGPRTPAYGSAAPSHFGGRMGSGFAGSVNNVRPAPYYGRSSPSLGARPYYGASPYHGGYGSYGGAGYGGYRGFGSSGGYGGYHAATPGIAPGGGRRGGYSSGESSGGFHSGGGGFHGGGGGFRGGGGGFHGGGGGRR